MMSKFISIVVFLIFFLSSLNGQTLKDIELTCDQFLAKIDSIENSSIFDIRLLELYEESRINNALWAGTKDSFEPYLEKLNKNSPIFIYCEVGTRTKQCLSWLHSKGYNQVYLLKRGFNSWVKNEYPIDTTKVKINN